MNCFRLLGVSIMASEDSKVHVIYMSWNHDLYIGNVIFSPIDNQLTPGRCGGSNFKSIFSNASHSIIHQVQTNNISAIRQHNENGGENVQMRDDGVIERRKLYETATGIVHTYMKTHKRNNHLIRFHAKGRVAWSETYEYTYVNYMWNVP